MTPSAYEESVPAPGVTGPCTVLVLGARGHLGYACVQAFAQAGWQVLAHVRTGSALAQPPEPPAPLPGSAQGGMGSGISGAAQVRWIDVPLQDRRAWQATLAAHGPVHVVVNALAPAFNTGAWRTALLELAQTSLVVARDAQALLLQPLPIHKYGRELPAVCAESDGLPPPEQVSTTIGRLRAELEWAMWRAAEAGQPVCMLRVGTVYGFPGAGWGSTTIAGSLPQGRMTWLGPYHVATPWMYVHDVAQTMERIASQRHRLGVWTPLHMAGQQRTGHDWWLALSALAQQRGWLQSGQMLHQGRLKWPVWRALGWLSPRLRALCELEYIWRTPHRLDNQQLRALIGVEPCTDWQSSLDHTVQQLVQR